MEEEWDPWEYLAAWEGLGGDLWGWKNLWAWADPEEGPWEGPGEGRETWEEQEEGLGVGPWEE